MRLLRTQRSRILFLATFLPPLIVQGLIVAVWATDPEERPQGLWHVTWFAWALGALVLAIIMVVVAIALAIERWVKAGER